MSPMSPRTASGVSCVAAVCGHLRALYPSVATVQSCVCCLASFPRSRANAQPNLSADGFQDVFLYRLDCTGTTTDRTATAQSSRERWQSHRPLGAPIGRGREGHVIVYAWNACSSGAAGQHLCPCVDAWMRGCMDANLSRVKWSWAALAGSRQGHRPTCGSARAVRYDKQQSSPCAASVQMCRRAGGRWMCAYNTVSVCGCPGRWWLLPHGFHGFQSAEPRLATCFWKVWRPVCSAVLCPLHRAVHRAANRPATGCIWLLASPSSSTQPHRHVRGTGKENAFH